MLITFGKHEGESVELAVIKYPDYVYWMFGKSDAKGAMRNVIAESKKLISQFNSKPYVMKCHGCSSRATNCTVYQSNVHSPYWWCDTCNPYQTGAVDGKLTAIRTYENAIHHVQLYCNGKSGDMRDLIKYLSRGKGMPNKVTGKALEKFFG